ncbi:hypothetical protein CK203_064481 [Vitis vinifera]|uniref:Reverse transcriptase Ty1/copia-type domain-containing protein n=1 Tax=Vitis vinifera TaxID=29760 RepID=A0A438FQL4_VITVI|nr:hypothetical protein CK203_064481 [Vitis vinifera]
MHSEFEMSMMGELNFFLGLQIKQLKEGTFINQAKYIRDLLKRVNMEEAKTMKIPMSSSIKLDKDEKGKSIDSTMYKGMIESHLSVVKRILRDLKGTVDIGERRLTLGHKASAQLSHLSLLRWRLAKRQGSLQSDGLAASSDDFGVDFPDSGACVLIFSTLVHAFYSRATYGLGGPIISIIRGVEIQLDPENIYRIFDIAPIELKVYESKAWPTMPSFKLGEAIQRIHRDEVSYLEAFLMDSILTVRRICMGYLMMMHMISCCESTTRVLPYGRFLTKVFKDVGVDLSKETDFEAPSIYDTYDEQSLGQMKFEKASDGS